MTSEFLLASNGIALPPTRSIPGEARQKSDTGFRSGRSHGSPGLCIHGQTKLVDVDLVRTHRLRAPLDVCPNSFLSGHKYGRRRVPRSHVVRLENSRETDHGELGPLVRLRVGYPRP